MPPMFSITRNSHRLSFVIRYVFAQICFSSPRNASQHVEIAQPGTAFPNRSDYVAVWLRVVGVVWVWVGGWGGVCLCLCVWGLRVGVAVCAVVRVCVCVCTYVCLWAGRAYALRA
jgi:hypothetical protein